MKKIFMAIALCMASVAAFGQLNFGNQGSGIKVTSFFKDPFCEVCLNKSEQYVLKCNDFETKDGFELFLGDSKESAMTSLEQLDAWCNNAQVKDFIEVNQADGSVVLLYLYKDDQLIMSYGDIEYAKAKFASLTSRKKFEGQTFPFGYVMRKTFGKALEKLKSVK